MALELCRVVLVRPQIAANLGAAARVMRNMGLRDLVLVAPEADPDDRQARQLSTQGEEILDGARIVPDLGAALGDCVLVAGTSARTGGLFRRQSMGRPDEIMSHLVKSLQAQQPVALVFGPERTGLTNTEVSRCHYLIHIATDESYPALNLAQAVAICLYELRRTWLRSHEAPSERSKPATFEAQERVFEHLRTALEAIHFLYGDKADSLMHAVRHLLARAQPTGMEIELLHGLARQMLWFDREKRK
jgi:tRNA/rRNA methyltransferase